MEILTANDARWIRRLYVGVAAVAIVPIWCVRYLPTVDGPSHLYNSWVLRQLIRGTDGPLAQWFRIDWRPYPNWSGHAVMALLMSVVSPLVAEKLLVTGIVLLFLAGQRQYAGVGGSENRLYAFLGVPFAYNLMLQSGFYNFCLGASLYFLIVATWWRRRDRPDARTIALIAALLLFCYFSHLLPTALSIGSIGLLWLITLPRRRLLVHARHLIAFVPVAPLLVWFAPMGGAYLHGPRERGAIFPFLARMRILHLFDERQLVLTTAIAVIFGALIAATLIRRRWAWRESDAFALLFLAVIALCVLSQSAVADIQTRLSLFVVLTPLAALDLRLQRRGTIALAMAFAALALGYSAYVIGRYRVLGSHVDQFVRSSEAIGRRSTFVAVLYDIGPRDSVVPLYYHAIDYMAVKKESVDIENYEAVFGYFPIKFRPQIVVRPSALANPWVVDGASYASRAEYIFTWRMDSNPGLPAKLAPYYTLVDGRGSGAVFRSTVMISDPERILLPLAGSAADRGAPGGVFWRVEQQVHNAGDVPVIVFLSTPEPAMRRIAVRPGESAPVAANAPYAFASVPRSDAGRVQFTTLLRRIDGGKPGPALSVPAVREREFRRGKVVIGSVPFEDPFRVALRVWTQNPRADSVLVTLRDAGGRVLAAKKLPTDEGAGTLVDLVHDFGEVPQRGSVGVTVDAGRASVWAFASATHRPRRRPPFSTRAERSVHAHRLRLE